MLGHQPGFRHYLRVVITYSILLVAVVGGTYFVVQLSRGYQVNLSSQQFELTGLVRVESNPDANIFIDGEFSGDETPARLTLVEGSRTLALEQSGFQRWTRDITVQGGSVRSINYPFLIPFDVEDGTKLALDLADAATYSFDQNNSLIAVARNGGVTVFQLIDQGFEEPYRQVEIGEAETVDQIIWAESSEQLLISHVNDEGDRVWLVADISEPQTETADITQEVGSLKPEGFVVDVKQRVLLSGDEQLWLLDPEDKSLQLLTRQADAFTFNNSSVVWHDKTESESLQAWSQNQAESIPVLRDITEPPSLALSSYSNQTNIAYTHSDSTYVIVDALSAPFERELDLFEQVISISPGGLYVLGRHSEEQYVVHDIQQGDNYVFELTDELSALNWTSTHHFIALGDAGVYVIDFEGSNQRRVNFETARQAALNAQKTAVYSIVDQQLLETPLR